MQEETRTQTRTGGSGREGTSLVVAGVQAAGVSRVAGAAAVRVAGAAGGG
jgi:hypothetical protein